MWQVLECLTWRILIDILIEIILWLHEIVGLGHTVHLVAHLIVHHRVVVGLVLGLLLHVHHLGCIATVTLAVLTDWGDRARLVDT